MEIDVEQAKKEINRNVFDKIRNFGYKQAMKSIAEEIERLENWQKTPKFILDSIKESIK